ncbi:GNAT family N-acetyltransferase, partial [Escherichia coli]
MHYKPQGNAVLNRPVLDAERGDVLAPMTKGIRLTTGAEFADRDAAPMLALLNDPGFVRFIGDRNVRSEEQAREYIALRVLHSYALNGFGMYAIERLSDGAWLGNAGLV